MSSNFEQFTIPDIKIKGDQNTDPRLGHLLAKNISSELPIKVFIIGFPSDIGVSRNGGRPGAAEAPMKIREHLYNLTPNPENSLHADLLRQTLDVGDLVLFDKLSENQINLGKVVSYYLQKNIVPIILGGGHETAYGHFLSYVPLSRPMQILNIDAHADVRPLVDDCAHSGSPFRQAIQDQSGLCKKYTVAGLQPHAVSKQHVNFIKQKDGQILWRKDTTVHSVTKIIDKLENFTMLTIDLDVVDQAYAPGVSAPATNGIKPDALMKIAEHAGKFNAIKSFDIVELNPKFDIDNQAAKLAALTVWHFLLGLSQRT